MLSIFVWIGVAKAQNEITMTVNAGSSVAYSLDERPLVLSYAPTSVTPIGNAGFGGLAFYWGYQFPASMLQEYVGKYITQVAYLEGGGEDYAGEYSVNIWLGGDMAPVKLATTQAFTVTSGTGTVKTIVLDQPVRIDGDQSIWVTLYQDGSVQGPAFVMEDMGDPNSRWAGLPAYDMWIDVNQAQGGSGYSFILWALVDDYDFIGEAEQMVSVYPNPTLNSLNVMAPDMDRVTVLNTLGQVVYDVEVSGTTHVVDLSHCVSGMYLVRVSTANGTVVKRVQVVR